MKLSHHKTTQHVTNIAWISTTKNRHTPSKVSIYKQKTRSGGMEYTRRVTSLSRYVHQWCILGLANSVRVSETGELLQLLQYTNPA